MQKLVMLVYPLEILTLHCFYLFIFDINTTIIQIQFLSQPNWYSLFLYHFSITPLFHF